MRPPPISTRPIARKIEQQVAPRSTAVLLLLAAASGCGYSGGEALFMSGLFRRPTIKAQFKLTEGPLAILVDDFQEHCNWPEATSILADQLARELKKHKAAKRFIASTTLRRLRQAQPNFDQLSTREIGELLEAEQVIVVQVRSFYATVEPTVADAAAQMSVAVKVVDAREKKDRTKVRLWPKSPTGLIVEAQLSAERLIRAKTRAGICRALTAPLAEKIAQNFYDRKMKDFEPS